MSALAIVEGWTAGGLPFYYQGRSGRQWFCIAADDALIIPVSEAERVAAKFNADYRDIGLRFCAVSRPAPAAILIYSTASLWDIYLMPTGRLESIPNIRGRRMGAERASYGDRNHLLALMREGYFNEANYRNFTEAGLEYMQGLSCSILPRGLVGFC